MPYPAGGPTDALARIVGQGMRAALGQTIVPHGPGLGLVVDEAIITCYRVD